jgi:predicted DNA-binding transcriptional regulator AlpA
MSQEAFTIPEFCITHRISRSTFYNLVKSDAAPRLMRVRDRVLISKEAAEEWRRACESAPTAGEAA